MVHRAQKHALKYLKMNPSARFSDLKPDDMTNDHFNFHVHQLLKDGLIEKNNDGLYQLTPEGKVTVNRTINSRRQEKYAKTIPKVTVLLIIRKKEDDKELFVVKRNRVHPFYDYLVFPTWGLRIGESLHESVDNNLPETTGLIGTAEPIGNIRRIITNKDSGEILQDTVFLLLLVDNATGDLSSDHHDAEQTWMTKKAILEDNKASNLAVHIFSMLDSPDGSRFVEFSHKVTDNTF